MTLIEAATLGIAIVGAAALFCVGVVVLGVGAWWFAKAVQAAHTARAHSQQADDLARITQGAEAVIEDVRKDAGNFTPAWTRPTDAELEEYILASRNGHAKYEPDYTTEGNEAIPEKPPIGGGGMYRGMGGFE
jgi:hypothetical protein